MNTLSILTLPSLFRQTKHSQFPHFRCISQSLPFPRPSSIFSPLSFRLSFKSPRSPFSAEPQLFDEELEDDEDDDDFEAADEYDEYEDISGEVSDHRMAIEAFLRGSSVVVSAPTSSGKTLIAEAAAVATVARRRRLFYTTPLKALSNQKFRQFRETFGDNNVGLLTGDSAVNKDAQILVLTTEILRNMLYNSVGMASSGSGLFHVDVIVLDEVHYLSDISRGTVWEEIVIYCPKEVQLICLSATVANPDELAGWISQCINLLDLASCAKMSFVRSAYALVLVCNFDISPSIGFLGSYSKSDIHGKTELVTSSWRPVPLTWHFSTKASLFPLLNEKGTHMNRKLSLNYLQLSASGVNSYRDDGSRRRNYRDDGSRRRNSRRHGRNGSFDSIVGMSEQPLSKNDKNMIRRSQVPQVVDTLWQLKAKDMLPAIWFIFNRRGCDAAVQYVEDCSLLDECEMSEVELALKKFQLLYPDAVRENAVKGLIRGVAAHHAGCLPLWKSFVEELFQRGLVKVVFATETLAAGINMPARTAVISSLSKRTSTGRIQLSPNELLQMAGRAGRRGIDERGHVVIVQTPYEGAEESCKLLFSGVEPLVSQFTASYGMVLNLLGGAKVTRHSNESDETNTLQARRTLEEARKLVEQSFGNYLGSNVMLAAKEELAKIQKEIEALTYEISDEAIDRKSRKLLTEVAYKEIADLQEELRAEKRVRTELRRRMELKRFSALKPLLKDFENGHLPFICLQYKDSEGVENFVPAVYLAEVESLDGSKLKNMVSVDDSFALSSVGTSDTHQDVEPAYYVALGSDNSWYLFTEKWIKTVYRSGFPNVALTQGEALPREIMRTLLKKEETQWEKLADSELGGLWCIEGSLETWSWSLNVPVLSSLYESDEVLHMSQEYIESVERYREQRNKVARLKKKIARTEGFREYKKILDTAKFTEEKIKRLKARSNHLINRIEQIEPSGWKEFLQISKVIHETRALEINTHVIFPLGETAAAIRGENELWLAKVLRNKILLELKPAQLAAVCASLVSEGIKVRAWKNNNYIYESSPTVLNVISLLEEQRNSFVQLQEKHEVEIACCLDGQFSGMVEAWASGLSWRELMMDCAMDEGDLARLLRRTIDLLAQIPKLPDIDTLLQKNATTASDVMDRPPISELTG
ncbi:hypothetical protein GOBAR_AA36054 [Gossypium barbadense]|uniref:Helicase ATP-binding domain-containing protein n=1 Tax=Gossypium barbadense TaxID=3634 RepID=A0A2P5W0Q2_GOSBA|nr:hypothetical protein GOBAR_AA36054 [Gossypium barbadense]